MLSPVFNLSDLSLLASNYLSQHQVSYQDLLNAVENNNLDEAKRLLNSGLSIKCTDEVNMLN